VQKNLKPCFALLRHALNLATSDTVKNNRILRDVLDTVFEITKLLKFHDMMLCFYSTPTISAKHFMHRL